MLRRGGGLARTRGMIGPTPSAAPQPGGGGPQTPAGVNRYVMRQRMFALGQDFSINDAAGQPKFKIDGKVRFEGLKPGEYWVGARDGEPKRVEVQAGANAHVELVVGREGGRISGTVVSGKAPVEGARISASCSDSGYDREGSSVVARSAADGSFAFEPKDGGVCAVRAEHDRFGRSAQVTLRTNGPPAEISLLAPGSISGRVTEVEVNGRRFDVHPGWNRLRLGLRDVRSLRVRIARVVRPPEVKPNPGGLRELHWHPNADEWQYYISGRGRMTVFGSHGRARTDEFGAGDVGYAPQGYGHYIENTGTDDLEVLLVLSNATYESISITAWMAATPRELLARRQEILMERNRRRKAQ